MSEHRDLTDSDGLHEPKGISVASNGQVYVANGFGTGLWKTSLQHVPNTFVGRFKASTYITVTAANTPEIIDSSIGTWTSEGASGNITLSANGRLTFLTGGTYVVTVEGIASPNSAVGSVNELQAVQMWNTGIQPSDEESKSIQFYFKRDSDTRDPTTFGRSTPTVFSPGDYIDFFHVGLDNSRDIWYDQIHVSVFQIGS